jgi:hypothetical protein
MQIIITCLYFFKDLLMLILIRLEQLESYLTIISYFFNISKLNFIKVKIFILNYEKYFEKY